MQWIEDKKESQNVVHLVSSPLNFFIFSFGSLTWVTPAPTSVRDTVAGTAGISGVCRWVAPLAVDVIEAWVTPGSAVDKEGTDAVKSAEGAKLGIW